MSEETKRFLKPTPTEQFINKLIGKLPEWGIGPKYMQVLEVTGRKSGKTYRTPVNLMEVDGELYVVAPRGETQWIRNARAAGVITLKRGKKRTQYHINELPTGKKAALLKEYLERYESAVQQYFPVQAGSDIAAFAPVEDQYPVLQLKVITE